MAEDLSSLFPIIEDHLAIKILACWAKIQDPDLIAQGIGLHVKGVDQKLGFLKGLGLINENGISDIARRFLQTQATAKLQKLIK